MIFRFKVVQASKYLVIMLHDSKHMVEKLKHLENTKPTDIWKYWVN